MTRDHLPKCRRCEMHSCLPEEWAARLDGMIIERWRCGLCFYAFSIVKRPPRHDTGKRRSTDYIVTARWVGINEWVNGSAA